MASDESVRAWVRAPHRYRVTGQRSEGRAGALLRVELVSKPVPQPLPGQYVAITSPGIPSLPATISALPDPGGTLGLTLGEPECRRAGLGTWVGRTVELRGPLGRGWDLEPVLGGDLVMVASERGLPSLLPVLAAGVGHPDRHPRQWLLVEARRSCRLPFLDQVGAWQAAGRRQIIAVTGGRFLDALAGLTLRPRHSLVLLAVGLPTVRAVAHHFTAAGLPGHRLQVGLHTHVRCVDASCGRCRIGGVLPCADGPVLPYLPSR